MRILTKCIVSVALLPVMMSCSNRDTADSTTAAEKENKDVAREADRKQDYDFAVRAADGGMFEVMLGAYAAENGTTQDIRLLGEMMVKDHTKANDELKNIASAKAVSLPSMLGDKLQEKYDDLIKKQGSDFDEAYASAMVNDHKQDLDEFRKEALSGKDEDIRSFAGRMVSILEHHLSVSERVKSSLE